MLSFPLMSIGAVKKTKSEEEFAVMETSTPLVQQVPPSLILVEVKQMPSLLPFHHVLLVQSSLLKEVGSLNTLEVLHKTSISMKSKLVMKISSMLLFLTLLEQL